MNMFWTEEKHVLQARKKDDVREKEEIKSEYTPLANVVIG